MLLYTYGRENFGSGLVRPASAPPPPRTPQGLIPDASPSPMASRLPGLAPFSFFHLFPHFHIFLSGFCKTWTSSVWLLRPFPPRMAGSPWRVDVRTIDVAT